jgi:hypothetical protein
MGHPHYTMSKPLVPPMKPELLCFQPEMFFDL